MTNAAAKGIGTTTSFKKPNFVSTYVSVGISSDLAGTTETNATQPRHLEKLSHIEAPEPRTALSRPAHKMAITSLLYSYREIGLSPELSCPTCVYSSNTERILPTS